MWLQTGTGAGLLHAGTRAAILCLISAFVMSAWASPIKITVTDPTPHYDSTIKACRGNGDPKGTQYVNCFAEASLDTTSLDGSNADFKKSFDAWNALQTDKWTMEDGKALPGGQFDVSQFDAVAGPLRGALAIQIDWNGYAGADRKDFVWAQGLLLRPPADGAYSMDVKKGQKPPQPLYPFQYADQHFFDRPARFWPDSFFQGEAFLTKVDTKARKLTVYEGVSYTLQLSACEVPEKFSAQADVCPLPTPEPSAGKLGGSGVLVLAIFWLRIAPRRERA